MNSKQVKKKVTKQAEKVVKNNRGGVLVVAVFFLLFLIVGVVVSYTLTKNDGLKLTDDKKEYTVEVGETVEVGGATFTLCGKDASGLVQVKTYNPDGEEVEIDYTTDGEFYVVYSVDTEGAEGFIAKLFVKRYSDYKLVKHITIGTVA